LDEGNTIPFIARYRKEMTKGASDEQLRDFYELYSYTKNLEARKQDVIRLIEEKGLMTDELRLQILSAETLARVEDLYRPFKEKKNTKATIAKAKGLEPLAQILAKAELSKEDFEAEAEKFVKDTGDAKTSVKNGAEAIQGAKDILAEAVSDHADLRAEIKQFEELNAKLQTKATKTFEENGVYKIYKDYNKKLSEMPSYAYLAVSRAEKEKQLSVGIEFSQSKISEFSTRFFVPQKANSSVEYLHEAIEDGLTRLLLPSIERELRSDKKRWADEAAIRVFGDNLKNLLLTPPVKGLTVLGFDPAFRTGCKLAVVDQTGKFLAKEVIYPTEPQNKIAEAEKSLLNLVEQYGIDLIVIGNGTASRESEKVVADFIKKNNLKVQYVITSEAGASVYSASQLAQDEYPNLDVTIRGAISIAHRVQDPLAELTKIDPKAIGIGQYQHDVDRSKFKRLEKENKELKDLLDIKDSVSGSKQVVAEIVDRSYRSWDQEFIIDKGISDGVSDSMFVLSSGGVIGFVESVEKNSSKVKLLFEDHVSSQHLTLKIEGQGQSIFALLNGYDEKSGELRLLQIGDPIEIKTGSLVSTSGLGKYKSGDLPVGTVTSVQKASDQLGQEIRVKPKANLDVNRFVVLIGD